MKSKILVVCHDVIGRKMAGPGIRYQNIANVLQKHAQVNLAVLSQAAVDSNSNLIAINPNDESFKKYFDDADIIFAQWLSNDMLAYAKSQGKILIFDLYAPVPIEYLASLEFSKQKLTADNDAEFSAIITMYNNYFESGQLFTCSNERQRDFWVGYWTANQWLRPTNFGKENGVQKLVLCPMGIDSNPPKPKELLLRKQLGIAKDDFVLLWTGGIWDWFDARVVIQAMDSIDDKKVKLVFMGTKHPNSSIEEMSESKAARQLSDKLGLTGKSIFFMDGWVPYEDRDAFLMDANASIYCDKESLETRFSHRTRVLDHIWASLPTICSKGDYLSTVIKESGLGIVTDDRTPEAFASAILSLKSNSALRSEVLKNLQAVRDDFTWETTLKPLTDFVQDVNVKEMSAKIKKQNEPIKSGVAIKTPSKPIKRRVKNSIKVLLGRVDV